MLATITLLGIILLSIICINLSGKYHDEFLEMFWAFNIVFGSALLIISIIIIIFSHISAPRIVQENKLEYDSLCKRYEVIKSEYEDVSKSDVIADINAWNKEVYNRKYWTYNPWTNWFNPKEIADNLNYISLE